jgi:general secretion pathway protein G
MHGGKILPGTGRGTMRSMVEGAPRAARGPLHHPPAADGPPPRAGEERGFTLVELMVVIVILGLLATVVVINVMPAQDTARVKKAQADIALLEQAAELYRLNKLDYPTTAQGLEALVSEGFVKRLPDDPWGNPYRYAAPGGEGRAFEISSLGADGREGGEGDDADIGNW